MGFVFIFTLQNSLWAAVPQRKLWPLQPTEQTQEKKILTVKQLRVPQALGTVIEAYSTPDSDERLALLIQDAHCHYEVQKNIAGLIGYLNQQYQIPLVGLEGGFGRLDPEPFKSFPDHEVRDRVTDFFVKRGELSGAEYNLITQSDAPAMMGIDNLELYNQSLKLFQEIVRQRKELLILFNKEEEILIALEKKYFNSDLQDLSQLEKQYESQEISLTLFIDKLTLWGSKKELPPSLASLLKASASEKKIDQKKLEAERKELLKRFEKTLSKESMLQVVSQSLFYRLGQMSSLDYHKEIYRLWKEEVAKKGESFKNKYPHLSKQMHQLLLMHKLSQLNLVQDAENYKKEIFAKHCTSEKQKELLLRKEELKQIKALCLLEVEQRNANEALAAAVRIESLHYYFESEAKQMSRSLPLLAAEKEQIKQTVLLAKQFYKITFQRDMALTQEALKLLRNSDKILLVTGGFHTAGIKSQLKEKDISYAVIQPRMTQVDVETPYLEVMLGHSPSLNQIWQEWNAMLSPLLRLAKADTRNVEAQKRELLDAFTLLAARISGMDQEALKEYLLQAKKSMDCEMAIEKRADGICVVGFQYPGKAPYGYLFVEGEAKMGFASSVIVVEAFAQGISTIGMKEVQETKGIEPLKKTREIWQRKEPYPEDQRRPYGEERVVTFKSVTPEGKTYFLKRAKWKNDPQETARLNYENNILQTIINKGKKSAYFPQLAFTIQEEEETVLVTDFFEGKTLLEIIYGEVSSVWLLSIMQQLLEALVELEKIGIVHRDLKLGNILVREDPETRLPQIRIIDFEFAHPPDRIPSFLSERGMTFGTPGYLSPEVVRGKEISYPSDLFTLGIVFYGMLTQNRLPFNLFSSNVLNEQPQPLNTVDSLRKGTLSEKLVPVVEKMLQGKTPEERVYQGGAVEVLNEIKKLTSVAVADDKKQEMASSVKKEKSVEETRTVLAVLDQITETDHFVSYKAKTAEGKIVFLKIPLELEEMTEEITDESMSEEKAEQKLIREAEALQKVNQQNPDSRYFVNFADYLPEVTVEMNGVQRTSPALVTEYVEGESLEKLITENKIPAEQIPELMRQMLEALKELHDAGFVHRDIKPANIMVFGLEEGNPQIKIIDLGLVWPSGAVPADVEGSFNYMSIDALLFDEPCWPRQDLYALGVILYELATKNEEYPYWSSTQLEMEEDLFDILLLRPELGERALTKRKDCQIDSKLAAIIDKMLNLQEKTPSTMKSGKLYNSADEVLADLEQVLSIGLSSPATEKRIPLDELPYVEAATGQAA